MCGEQVRNAGVSPLRFASVEMTILFWWFQNYALISGEIRA